MNDHAQRCALTLTQPKVIFTLVSRLLEAAFQVSRSQVSQDRGKALEIRTWTQLLSCELHGLMDKHGEGHLTDTSGSGRQERWGRA